MPAERISPREWRRVVVFAALILCATTIPYVVGWLAAGEDWRFSGMLFGVEDGNSYLAKMRIGAGGDWLFVNRYTSEPHRGALFFLPYILLGHLARLLAGGQPVSVGMLLAVYHGARVVFGLALILAIYRFVAAFVRAPALRRLALLLATLGGGLGWLLSLAGLGDAFGSLPLDFYVPEGYSFLILFGLPHLALARAALLAGFLALLDATARDGAMRTWLGHALLAGVAWFVTGLCVPFYIAVVYVLLGMWGLAVWVRRRRFPWDLFWRAAVAALVPLPLLLYSTWVFAVNDVFAQWAAQNRLPSPHPLHYALGYAALAIPAAAAIPWAWRRGAQHAGYLLLVSWLVAAPVLVYVPVNVQRRLAEGIIVPLGILAAVGLRRLAPRRRRLAQAALLALVLPTSGLLWLGGLASVLAPGRPIFRPVDEITALQALNAVAPRGAVVLSRHETGNLVPVYTDLIAFVGHGPETVDAETKERRVVAFFRNALSPDERAALLAEVDYVLAGPLERAEASGGGWQAGLREVAVHGSGPGRFAVYEVQRD